MNWHDYFKYEDGKLVWRERRRDQFSSDRAMNIWNARFSGSAAGAGNGKGYMIVSVNRKRYLVHRIIFEMHNGPIDCKYDIDHIDRNNLNNRIENLRLASREQNNWNMKGGGPLPKGIYYEAKYNKYRASISVKNKTKYIGRYDDIDSATKAYNAVADSIRGEFHYGGK